MSNIYVRNRIDAFTVLLRKNIYNFIGRSLESSNVIVNALMTSEFFENSCLSSHWKTQLYL